MAAQMQLQRRASRRQLSITSAAAAAVTSLFAFGLFLCDLVVVVAFVDARQYSIHHLSYCISYKKLMYLL
jgi:uncharacterized membrane protein YdbT with pleckstrin-like domain